MKYYMLDDLLNDIQDGAKPNYVYFWGHQKTKLAGITASCFSQWWTDSPFMVDGINYLTAEHWMMVKKALLFNDTLIHEKIIMAPTAKEAKALGRQVQNFNASLWEEHAFNIVVEGNYHKFVQNSDIKEYLLSTEESILVEASPVDAIWGIGLAVDDAKAKEPEEWQGLNLLGFALMAVRDRIFQQ